MPIVTDDFNRAAEDPIGSPWASVTNTTNLRIIDGAFRVGANATSPIRGAARYTVDLGNDCEAQVLVAYARGGAGPAVRISSTAETYYYGSGNANGVGIFKVVAGTLTTLWTTNSITVADGDTLRLQAVGTRLRLFKNGTEIGNATDSSIASGQVGMSTYYSAGLGGAGSPDNFAAWTYGLPGAPGLNGPIYTGETVVNGLGTPGLSVEVYKNSALAGTVLVDATGKWSYTFGAGLATGDVVKGRQKNASGDYGTYCPDVTAQAAVVTPPTVASGLYASCTDVVGYAKPGVNVEVFKGGVSQTTVAADGFGVFRYTTAGLTAGDVWTAKQTIAGTQSAASASVTVKAAPTDTDTYKTSIFGTLDTYDFSRLTQDNDDIRRSVALVLDQAALAASSTHDIKNAMLELAYQYAARIRSLRG